MWKSIPDCEKSNLTEQHLQDQNTCRTSCITQIFTLGVSVLFAKTQLWRLNFRCNARIAGNLFPGRILTGFCGIGWKQIPALFSVLLFFSGEFCPKKKFLSWNLHSRVLYGIISLEYRFVFGCWLLWRTHQGPSFTTIVFLLIFDTKFKSFLRLDQFLMALPWASHCPLALTAGTWYSQHRVRCLAAN